MTIVEELAKKAELAAIRAKIDSTCQFLRERALKGELTLLALREILNMPYVADGDFLMQLQVREVFQLKADWRDNTSLERCMKQISKTKFCHLFAGHDGPCDEDGDR